MIGTNLIKIIGGYIMKEALAKIVENFAKLINVKTVLSFTVVGALTSGFLQGSVPVEVYAPLATAIVTYFFTRKE